jgi:hypothetical protein
MSYRFQCPSCGRKYKANKDLEGRLKRCGRCRRGFTIQTAAVKLQAPSPSREPETVFRVADPEIPIDEVFSALAEWQKRVRSLPRSFGREVTFGQFEPAYRVTLEAALEEGVRRLKRRAERETLAIPEPLAAEARGNPKPVADLPFHHSGPLLERLPAKYPAIRRAAEDLIREVRPAEGGRFASRRIVVEHLPVWKATWVFHEREGEAWFSGRPLRVYLPDPPRRSAWPAVAAILLALAAGGGALWAVRELGSSGPAAALPAALPPAPPPAMPKPEPLRFARDGVLQLDDGTFLRGSLERREESVVVQAGGPPQAVPTAQIESVHLDAPAFLRGERRRLDDLEGRVKAARDARRETLVGLFLEVHRQRDRWARLEQLVASEPPAGGRAPRERLEGLRIEIEELLERKEPVAALPSTAPKAAPAAPQPAPAASLAASLLGRMDAALDLEARRRLAGNLVPLRTEKLPQADLLHFAVLYLSRSDLDAGLAVDRLHLKTGQVDSTFEGVLERRTDAFAGLRTAAGQEVTAYREGTAWTAQLPGGIRLEGAECSATPAAPTVSGERLRAALDRLPPSRWMAASGGEHLRAAKGAADALARKGAAAADRGLVLLRLLAAAHASAALRIGTAAEILEARVALSGLGYSPSAEGRWERADDRRAAQLGQLLREGRAAEARSQLPGGRDFAGAYRSAAVGFQAPIRTREEFDRAAAALDQAIAQAWTAAEGRHLLALRSAVSAFGVCAQCGGNSAKACTFCKGKGQRTEACAACRGLGYIATVGIGATGARTCDSCGGRPIKGTRPCERCEGKGTRSCARCQGASRLPAGADVARTSACARCSGAGGQGDLVLFGCPSCLGLGLQLLPAGAPDAVLP